jgi:hypothetical protein
MPAAPEVIATVRHQEVQQDELGKRNNEEGSDRAVREGGRGASPSTADRSRRGVSVVQVKASFFCFLLIKNSLTVVSATLMPLNSLLSRKERSSQRLIAYSNSHDCIVKLAVKWSTATHLNGLYVPSTTFDVWAYCPKSKQVTVGCVFWLCESAFQKSLTACARLTSPRSPNS